jgi:diguanylate cyclase (GGDEF)-like protein
MLSATVMQGRGAQVGRFARTTCFALLAAALLVVSYLSEPLASANLALTALALGVFVVRVRVMLPELRRTFGWLLAAIGAGALSGLLALVLQLVGAGRPAFPSVADVVGLAYIPLTVAALLVVPLQGRRRGYRARSLADGFVAASSLLYLFGPYLDTVTSKQDDATAAAFALAFPLGGVFIVAAGLTGLARCTYAARPVLLWVVLGVSVVSAADLAYVLSPDTGLGVRRATFELGLLLLFRGAVPRRPGRAAPSPRETPRLLAALPFVPFACCVVYSTHLVLEGHGLDAGQLLLAIVVALALVARQLVASRDKDRLVEHLARREARLQAELRVDPLTGVANRLGLEEALRARLDSGGEPVALLLLDLDDFKVINDNHGHAAGDEVLRHVAQRLRGSVRGHDVVARLGGDEFALLLDGAPGELELLSRKVARALRPPIQVSGQMFRVAASLGLVASEPDDSVDRLIADADAAMYEAKADPSRANLVVLDRAGRAEVATRSRLREHVAHPALEQFAVHYQPVVDLRSREVIGMEALMRWEHPELGRIAPDVFIPLAEQTGSIGVLGDLVLRTAIADLAALGDVASPTPFAVGVNVSPRQLAWPGFKDRVEELLRQHGVSAQRLVVEITEQAFETDIEQVGDTVHALREAGVTVAVDDFGTGYSSLRYLQHLELDIIKVDKKFLYDVVECARSQNLVSGIFALARQLDLRIVAEGIETPAQLEFLDSIGCDLGQGFLFSRPLPYDELADLLAVPAEGARVPVPRAPEAHPVTTR